MLVCLLLCLAACLAPPTIAVDWDVETPLDIYVQADDPAYGYSVIQTYDRPDFTVHVINMTSQKWLNESFTEEPIWWHYLSIFIPKTVRFNDAAHLFMGAGNNYDVIDTPDTPPEPESESRMRRCGDFTTNTGAVCAYLKHNPFQPVYFTEDPIWRLEDLIIGYTWREYIEAVGEPNPDVVLQLPMTKVAKAAMDTIASYCKEQNPSLDIDRFMPSGYSKRGWAAWLIACSDRRVFALAPIVFDLLNFYENLIHHYRAMGGWSWAFTPYWMEDVPRYLHHPRTQDLGKIIDPFAYNERLTMPKLIQLGAGDQFFLVDDSHYYWDQLTSPKYFMMYENDDHGLGSHRDLVWGNLESFFVGVLTGFEFPELSWQREVTETGGAITLNSVTPPLWVRGWKADTTNWTCEAEYNNTCRRDFRLEMADGSTGNIWNEESVEDLGGGNYRLAFDNRDDNEEYSGFRGFHIEINYGGPEGRELRLSTEANILPDILPFPNCQTEEECQGEIV